RARQNIPTLGTELIEVRSKSVNYVREVEQRVYERMISERRRIAARFRSEGDGASAKIRGEKERELDRLRSEAYRKAQETIGKADAEAARIYAEAYGQDPEFYAFYQTLEAYKQTLQKNASLLVTTGSDFYRYLKYVDGKLPQPMAKDGKPCKRGGVGEHGREYVSSLPPHPLGSSAWTVAASVASISSAGEMSHCTRPINGVINSKRSDGSSVSRTYTKASGGRPGRIRLVTSAGLLASGACSAAKRSTSAVFSPGNEPVAIK